MKTLRVIPLLLVASWLTGCTLAPSPYGGPPVVDRSAAGAPIYGTQPNYGYPQQQPYGRNGYNNGSAPVEVQPLQRPQPLEPTQPLQSGPIVPNNPYGAPTNNEPAMQPSAPVNSAPRSNAPASNASGSAPSSGSNTQAVAALLSSASESVSAGQLDKAAASLERALRIEPRNAGIWHDLAQIRLHQRQYQQAESLATKSNSLASGNRSLQARNWTVIGAARRAAGDGAGADAAEAQATTLKR